MKSVNATRTTERPSYCGAIECCNQDLGVREEHADQVEVAGAKQLEVEAPRFLLGAVAFWGFACGIYVCAAGSG